MLGPLRNYPGRLGFFRRELGGATRLHDEVFYLAYYLHWQPSETLNLSTGDRKTYVRKLAERVGQENRDQET